MLWVYKSIYKAITVPSNEKTDLQNRILARPLSCKILAEWK